MKHLPLIAGVVVFAATLPGADLATPSAEELSKQLWSENSWQGRQAQRLTGGDAKAVEALDAPAGPGLRVAAVDETAELRVWAERPKLTR